MILDFRDRWVVCTPTKTGTTSLTALLCERTKFCGVKVLPVHRPDADPAVKDRLMTVRNPIDRWCSMYYFLRRDRSRMHQFAAQGDGLLDGLVPFAEEFFRRYDAIDWAHWLHADEAEYMWLWPLWRFAERFNPSTMWDVTQDSGRSLLKHLSSSYGYTFKDMPHMRRSKERESTADTMSHLCNLRVDLYDRVYAWASKDFDLLKHGVVNDG